MSKGISPAAILKETSSYDTVRGGGACRCSAGQRWARQRLGRPS
jgi:hypothetical protein